MIITYVYVVYFDEYSYFGEYSLFTEYNLVALPWHWSSSHMTVQLLGNEWHCNKQSLEISSNLLEELFFHCIANSSYCVMEKSFLFHDSCVPFETSTICSAMCLLLLFVVVLRLSNSNSVISWHGCDL